MGASVSSNSQKIQNTMITSATQSCGPAQASNTLNWNGVDLTAPADCPGGGNYVINQATTVDATCLLSALQSTAATTASTLNAQAQAGIGLAVSTNVNDINTNIQNITNQACAGTSSKNVADWKDVKINSCNLTITQNATDNQQCQINATQNLINQISASSAAQAQGASIWGLLFGKSNWVPIVIIIVVVMALSGIAIAYFKSNKGKNLDKGLDVESLMKGGYDIGIDVQKNKPYIILIVVILLIVLAFVINRSQNNSKQITTSDVERFQQSIAAARKIAGLSPYSDELSSASVSEPTGYDSYRAGNSQLPEYTMALDDFYAPLL